MESQTPYLDECARFTDMILLRALYLSWRRATRETPMQRADGILRFKE
jgi:hypothetical protein